MTNDSTRDDKCVIIPTATAFNIARDKDEYRVDNLPCAGNSSERRIVQTAHSRAPMQQDSQVVRVHASGADIRTVWGMVLENQHLEEYPVLAGYRRTYFKKHNEDEGNLKSILSVLKPVFQAALQARTPIGAEKKHPRGVAISGEALESIRDALKSVDAVEAYLPKDIVLRALDPAQTSRSDVSDLRNALGLRKRDVDIVASNREGANIHDILRVLREELAGFESFETPEGIEADGYVYLLPEQADNLRRKLIVAAKGEAPVVRDEHEPVVG